MKPLETLLIIFLFMVLTARGDVIVEAQNQSGSYETVYQNLDDDEYRTDFGLQVVGGGYFNYRYFKVTNASAKTIFNGTIDSTNDDFQFVAFPTNIAPNTTRDFRIRYVPTDIDLANGIVRAESCDITLTWQTSGSPDVSTEFSVFGDAVGNSGVLVQQLINNGNTVGAPLVPGSSLDFGYVSVTGGPTSVTKSLRMYSTGSTTAGRLTYTLTGAGAGDFSLSGFPSSDVNFGPNETADIGMTFNAGVVGNRAATMTVKTTTGVTLTSFNLQAYATISGANIAITPLDPGSYDFGLVNVGTSKTLTYRITNTGSEALTIQPVQVFPSPANYSVSVPPSVAPFGGTGTMSVTVNPTGLYNNTFGIRITSNAAAPDDEKLQSFRVQAFDPSSPPFMEIYGLGTGSYQGRSITPLEEETATFAKIIHQAFFNSGSGTINARWGTLFPPTSINDTKTARRFRIVNQGGGVLEVEMPTITGTNSSFFTVTGYPPGSAMVTIQPLSYFDFQIEFDPAFTGPIADNLMQVTVPSNTSNPSTTEFTYYIQGASVDRVPDRSSFYAFFDNSVPLYMNGIVKGDERVGQFIYENRGFGNLSLGVPVVSSPYFVIEPGDFPTSLFGKVSSSPDRGNFRIYFRPPVGIATGYYRTSVSIPTNDPLVPFYEAEFEAFTYDESERPFVSRVTPYDPAFPTRFQFEFYGIPGKKYFLMVGSNLVDFSPYAFPPNPPVQYTGNSVGDFINYTRPVGQTKAFFVMEDVPSP